MTQNRLTDGSDAPAPTDEQLRWFYGLDAIAHHMNWGKLKVLRMNQKHNFPLLRMPVPEGPRFWQYATNTLLILIWLNKMAEEAYGHIAQTRYGQGLRRTRAPKPAPAPNNTMPQPTENKGESNPRLITNIMSPLEDIGTQPAENVGESGRTAPLGGRVKPPQGQGD